MSNIASIKSVAETIDPKALSTSLSWTAGGASDAVTWTGISINRESFSNGSIPRSMDPFVVYDVTMASGHTLSLTWAVQDSADNSAWSDYATEAATVAVTGVSGGTRQVGVARMANPSGNAPSGTPGVDLNGARAYVRLNVIPDFSGAGTDTGVIVAAGEFGGFDILAAPTS